MRSRLFSEFDPESKDNDLFAKHLKMAMTLTDAQAATCISAFAKVRLARTQMETRQHLQALEKETHLPLKQIDQALSVVQFFFRNMMRDDYKADTTEEWAEDLGQLDLLNDDEKPRFITLIEGLRSQVLPAIENDIRRRTYGEGVLPTLKSCGTTVEMRAVQKDRYHWGESLETYVPQIMDITGVVSIHIGLDEGTPEDFYFQASVDDLDLLIQQFTAAKKDLHALDRFISTWMTKE